MIVPNTLFFPTDSKNLYSIFRGTGIDYKVKLFKSLEYARIISKKKNEAPVVLSIKVDEMVRDGLEMNLGTNSEWYVKRIPLQYINTKLF